MWDTTGDNVVEQLAGLDDYTMAIAAYWAAVEARPRDKITLRQGARVVGEKLDGVAAGGALCGPWRRASRGSFGVVGVEHFG